MASAGSSRSPSTSTTQPTTHIPKPFSISLSSNSRAPAIPEKSKPQNSKKRPHSSLADDSGSEHEDQESGPQLLAGFDQAAGGAIGINGRPKEKVSLVIPAQKNRDWREESRRKRGKNLLPAEVQGQKFAEKNEVSDGVTPLFGLTFVGKKEGTDVEMKDTGSSKVNGDIEGDQTEKPAAKTADEEAMEALLSGKKSSTLVIGDTGPDGIFTGRAAEAGVSDELAFKRDVLSRPDSASLDDYDAVPVEEFGAALLRGMGWKEGEDVGKRKGEAISKPKKVERRAPLLGIGAKEIPGNLLEVEGAWGKAAKGGNKRREADKSYSPVVLKNARTGEMLTEDEMKAKQEEEEDWKRRRDRNLAIDEERKAERGHRERERERERDREASSRSRHSSSRGDRHKDYDSSDYDKSSDKERSHRSRSGRDDSSTSRHKHRDRARSDIEDDRHSSSRSSPRGSDRERDEHRSRRREEVY
ncbi:MAG: hypothetical protein MMC33_000424 [Icmadophila ericetorum]|nr:hypothetical protein [Icmadophila ericetorum]